MDQNLPTPEKVKCPKCGSDQIAADKHGFSAGKAIGGAVLTGGIGLLAGFHGSKKIDITCLNCGNKFRPGDQKKLEERKRKEAEIEKSFEELKMDKKKQADTAKGCLIIIIAAIVIYFIFK